MGSFEQTTICGHLGQDPELRYTQTGRSVCNFSVAVDRSYTDSTGQRHAQAAWYRVATWGATAENCAQYLTKGSLVLVVGTVDASGFIDRDGKPAASRELTARSVQFLSSSQQPQPAGDMQPVDEVGDIPF